jgi:2-C-methyl-D-erythritol 2,4-cyclodiphosphate synthase
MSFRIGQGFDVHAFGDGDHVVLGGVRIPHDRGLAAHSDGDVALHALCDALLGAAARGDIGQHFPPTDARWAGAATCWPRWSPCWANRAGGSSTWT